MGSFAAEPEDFISYEHIYHPIENYSSICTTIGMVNSRGLFRDTNPLDYSVPLILAQFSLASMVILFMSRMLKPLGQPSMVVQILGGLLLGPSFLGRISGVAAVVYPFKSLIMLDTAAVFGCMFYFFLIGVKMDPWILKKIQVQDICVGTSAVFLSMVLSISGSFFLLTGKLYLDPDTAASLLSVATVSSMIGFPTIAHYLTELGMVNSEVGRRALSSSLVSNLLGFCVVTATFLTKHTGGEIMRNMQTLGIALIFALAIAFVVRPIILWEMRKHPAGEPLTQGFISMVLVGALASGFCSKVAGLNVFLGPLLYGIAIPAGPPLGSALVEKMDFITIWLFMPLYFVKSGMVTDIFSVKLGSYLVVQCTIFLATSGKFLGAVMASVYTDLSLMEAIRIGMMMNAQGVLELGLYKMMRQSKAIHEEAWNVMCLSMLLVTGGITPILRYLHDSLRREAVEKRRTVMDLRPDSGLNIVACVHHNESVPPIIDLIEALHPSRLSPIHICLIHLVRLLGRSHPILIPHKLNRVQSKKAATSRSIVNAFNYLQQRHHGTVSVHPFTAICSSATMHDQVFEMAIERRASLIIAPFNRRSPGGGMEESSDAAARTMIDKLLQVAPCTVGIIVDQASIRGFGTELGTCYLCRAAIFFVGGADDREGMAIGARMVGQRNIQLTVVRILAHIDVATGNADEAKLDDDAVNRIRSQNAGNPMVGYIEHVVADGTGVVAVIRSMEDQYELIIVGRYHDTRSPLMQGLAAWEEDSELGAVGDMFALPDSNINSRIFVVQQRNHILRAKSMNRQRLAGLTTSTSTDEGTSSAVGRGLV